MDPNLGESSQSSTCAFCHRILSSDNDVDALSVCSDCKFLLLEDLEATSPEDVPLSRTRYDSSESIESMFSQQFSQLIHLARQNHDGDGSARLTQDTSSRTTPTGSRRWRRVFSDTESDGFDSLYGGESESNVSFRRYRAFHGETDTISYSLYGGDSDASVDGRSFMENENLGHPSDLESDTDIDPMNAGLYQWNSDDDDSEWEEADNERNTVESLSGGGLHPRSNGTNFYNNWRRQFLSPEVEATFPLNIHERIQARTGEVLTDIEESEAPNYVGESGDYLDGRGLENLLERLAETENSRRGAPPASVSFINNNMPCMTISEDKLLDSMACAICKDSFIVGTVVNQLPCFHLFHPCCILPWLSTRNTCPLCRHELPTDDMDYEARKRNERNHIHPHDVNSDGSLGVTNDTVVDEISQLHHDTELSEQANADSVRNGTRNRWFYLAAPIVSILGVSLVLCFGNPSQGRRCPSARIPHRRENNSQRRWWSFF